MSEGTPGGRRARALGPLLLAVMLTGSGRLAAQGSEPGSRMLATDHWSYEYVQRLRDRGYLGDLNPLAQPYRRRDVARGLMGLDPDSLREPVAEWVRLLRQEFGFERDRLAGRPARRWGAVGAAVVRGSSSRRLDALRPLGEGGAWPRFNAGFFLETGRLAMDARGLGDFYFAADPDGQDPGQRHGLRSDHAYVSVRLPFGEVALGRFKRNWSALGSQGLMVSDVATSYPQIGIEFGLGRFALRAFTGELDAIAGYKRYISAHRVDYSTGRLTLSFAEALLYATKFGGPQLRYLNPIEVPIFEHDNEPTDLIENLVLEGLLWYRTGRVVLYAQGLLDDVDLSPDDTLHPDPVRAAARYSLSAGVRLTDLAGRVEPGLSYEQVSAFAYRTVDPAVDRFTFLGRGLGPNFNDYDRLRLFADVYPPVRGLRVSPSLAVQRQGEGNLREPISVSPGFRGQPDLFLGVTEATYRVSLGGRYQPSRFLWVCWDGGWNFVSNAQHRPGDRTSKFSATAEVGVSVDLPVPRDR